MTDPGPYIVALDTCTPTAAVAVTDLGGARTAGRTLAERPNQTSEQLAGLVHACLDEAGVGPAQVAAVAVAVGPGTFTGTRVGIAFALGLAVGWGVDVVPLSPLEVVARAAGVDGRVLACLDARKGEVYAAAYVLDGPKARALAPAVRAPIAEALADGPFDAVVGPGADAHADALDPKVHRPGVTAAPGPLAVAARRAHARGAAVAPEAVEPLYLRKSYAELGIHRPKRPVFRSPLLDSPDPSGPDGT